MCFSPAASFVVSGTLAVAAAAVSKRKIPKHELAMAVVPMLFAIQQFFEGIVWLYFYTPGVIRGIGLYGFTFFGFIFWPIYPAWSALRAEVHPVRRKLLQLSLAAGIVVSLSYLVQFALHGTDVVLVQQCLQYQVPMSRPMEVLYGLSAVGPLFFLGDTWALFGGILITLGAVLAKIAYPFAVASIWCYFAAIATLAIALHFFLKYPRK